MTDTCRNGHPYTPENTGHNSQGRLCRTCFRERKAKSYQLHYSDIRKKQPQGAWKFIKERAAECQEKRERKKKLAALKRERQRRQIQAEMRRSLSGRRPSKPVRDALKERVLCGLRAGFWRHV